MSSSKVSPIFSTAHFASSPLQMARRVFELGPTYYFLELPRFLRQRRQKQIDKIDFRAFTNPFHELLRRSYFELTERHWLDAIYAQLETVDLKISLPQSRFEAVLYQAWISKDVAGDWAEFGCYQGTTSVALALLNRYFGIPRKVYALDTFAGAPKPSLAHDFRQTRNAFSSSNETLARLENAIASLQLEDWITVYPGLFSETLPKINEISLSFAHIDANLYAGTFDATEYCLDALVSRGSIVFDDYNGVGDLGARLAIQYAYQQSGYSVEDIVPLCWCSSTWQKP